MSTVRYFRHDDPGAPTLTGEVGSLTTLLRKCLVGVGGVAYGAKPSAGWSEEFIGAASNIAVFRNSQAEGFSGCYVRAHDNAPGAGGAREARINTYATMSDVNTGTGGMSNLIVRKSSTLSAVVRPWQLVADGGTVYLHVWGTGDTATSAVDNYSYGFGDYDCAVPTGTFRYMQFGKYMENGAGYGGAWFDNSHWNRTATTAGWGYVAALNGVGAPVGATCHPPGTSTSAQSQVGGAAMPTAPDAAGNRNFLHRPLIRTATGYAGRLRGIAFPLERLYTEAAGAQVPGMTNLRVMKGNGQQAFSEDLHGAIAVDTVGPW